MNTDRHTIKLSLPRVPGHPPVQCTKMHTVAASAQAGERLSQQASGAAPPSLVADLAVHVAWGQGSSLAVEAAAALLGLWAYQPCGWNLSLARLPNGKHLTLLPQAIWLAASTAFVLLSHLR